MLSLCRMKGELVSTPLHKDGELSHKHNGKDRLPLRDLLPIFFPIFHLMANTPLNAVFGMLRDSLFS
ncbi:hypothetical protein T07_10374 [Trichinella nelsoni]|uniref:Uncharacterized protein n=1 Tax=Trichinella nelsoni TaxID=6336 RepID=A0A0V0S3Z2_9BILA|nr:hypothetical protein T07_10374 [Trichinella nelsoni]